MNDFTVFIYAVFFFAIAGGTFAFMWKMTTISIESINKPTRRAVHPEMSEVQSGDELLVFKPESDQEDDDEGDVIIIRK